MAKDLQRHIFGHAPHITQAFKKSINNIITDSNNLTRNIYKWYELDNEDKITFTSRNDLHHDNHNLDKHRDYQADILMSIDIIKEKCDKLSNKIKKKQSSKYLKSLTNTLDNIESSITHEIFRNLQRKRRTEMNKVCRMERVENKIKVHNFTTLNINAKITDLLNHGPNYIPTMTIFDIKRQKKQQLTNIVKQITNTSSKRSTFQPIYLGVNNPQLDLETKIQSIDTIDEITKLTQENGSITKPDNLISEIMKELVQLSNRKDIVINIADKNMGFIINNTTWYIQELSRQLSDTATYIEICNCDQNDIIQISISNLNKLRQKYERLYVDKNILTRMTFQPKETIKLPSLNLLPKIHKLKNLQGNNLEQNLKGRPIVNGFQFTTSKISRILNDYMINIHDNFKILFEQERISFPCIANSDQLISELEKLPTFDFIDLTIFGSLPLTLNPYIQTSPENT